jgi:hypothetical protein
MRCCAALLLVMAASRSAAAEPQAAPAPQEAVVPERAPRRRDASFGDIFGGPFVSSRLFAMPTARVVGAYQLSLSGDASLLSEAGVLSTSSVVAVGFGDIAQLEYRNAAALTTLDPSPFGLPALGVQLEAPFRPRPWVPRLAVALRFGLPHDEESSDGRTRFAESATDFYAVSSLALGRVELHAGLRVSAAAIETSATDGGTPIAGVDRTLLLPAAGISVAVARRTQAVAELAMVPRFAPGDADHPSEIDRGIFGRAGIRWWLLPSVVFDASVGYRIEAARFDGPVSDMTDALVDWDMRLGGEIFVPWGALLCRGTGLFCE